MPAIMNTNKHTMIAHFIKSSSRSTTAKRGTLLLAFATLVILAATTACTGRNSTGSVDTVSPADDCALDRPDYMPDEEWAVIASNCDYFVRMLNTNKELASGKSLPASEVQELMPRNEQDFRLFYMLWEYAAEDCGPTDLYHTAAQYAAEDSLDMMEHVLNWSLWADSWEYPWEIAVEIEKRNPTRFRSTIERIWDKGWTAAYEEYRDAYLEWLSHPENQYDQFVFNQ